MNLLLIAILRQPQQMLTLDMAAWDLLLRQARAADLLGRLAVLARQAGVWADLPAAPRVHLESAQRTAEKIARTMCWEVDRVQRALAQVDTSIVLLKGAAYTLSNAAAAPGRWYHDLDILVPHTRLAAVESALQLAGWTSLHPDAYDQHYYRAWMHELPPLRNVERGTVLDVHHAILPLTARLRPDPTQLLAAAVSLPGQHRLQTLSPYDMLLHAMAHAFYDGDFTRGLRDLVDIDALLRQFLTTGQQWREFSARAQALDLALPCYYAVSHARECLATPVPDDILPELQTAAHLGSTRAAWMHWLMQRSLTPHHASCALRGHAIARRALYLRSHWLKMPPLLLARHLLHKAVRKQDN